MTETSTTNTTPAHPAGAVAHALQALTGHWIARRLPRPETIDLPNGREFDGLIVTVISTQADAWTGGDFVIDERHEDAPFYGSAFHWCRVDGRLPDTGVRVRIQWLSRTRQEVSA